MVSRDAESEAKAMEAGAKAVEAARFSKSGCESSRNGSWKKKQWKWHFLVEVCEEAEGKTKFVEVEAELEVIEKTWKRKWTIASAKSLGINPCVHTYMTSKQIELKSPGG